MARTKRSKPHRKLSLLSPRARRRLNEISKNVPNQKLTKLALLSFPPSELRKLQRLHKKWLKEHQQMRDVIEEPIRITSTVLAARINIRADDRL